VEQTYIPQLHALDTRLHQQRQQLHPGHRNPFQEPHLWCIWDKLKLKLIKCSFANNNLICLIDYISRLHNHTHHRDVLRGHSYKLPRRVDPYRHVDHRFVHGVSFCSLYQFSRLTFADCVPRLSKCYSNKRQNRSIFRDTSIFRERRVNCWHCC
jgi:hypothetical protein